MREPDQLDLLIDSALGTYAEAPQGLEDGILRVLKAQQDRRAPQSSWPVRSRSWIPWAIAGLAAACLVFALSVRTGSTHRTTVAHNPPLPLPHSDSGNRSRVTAIEAHPTQARTTRFRAKDPAPALQAAALPKLDIFPTPEPLAPQEQSLVAYLARASAPQRQALLASRQEPERPLFIPPIQIPPLPPLDPETNDPGNK